MVWIDKIKINLSEGIEHLENPYFAWIISSKNCIANEYVNNHITISIFKNVSQRNCFCNLTHSNCDILIVLFVTINVHGPEA